MPVVLLVTTMWKHVPPEVGADREAQLLSEFWGNMISNKCLAKRFGDSHESAWKLLDSNEEVLSANALPAPDAVDQPRHLKSKEATVTLNKQLERLIKDQKRTSKRITTLTDSGGSQTTRQELARRVAELDNKIAQTVQRMRELGLPIKRRILKWFYRNVGILFTELMIFLNLPQWDNTVNIPNSH
jgi:hypothetical protein